MPRPWSVLLLAAGLHRSQASINTVQCSAVQRNFFSMPIARRLATSIALPVSDEKELGFDLLSITCKKLS